jgi:hypothetical protein
MAQNVETQDRLSASPWLPDRWDRGPIAERDARVMNEGDLDKRRCKLGDIKRILYLYFEDGFRLELLDWQLLLF